MKYKILISDYDDTLIGDDRKISKKNREAIDRFTEAGGVFAVNTGRMLPSILPIARQAGFDGLLGAYQGGVIVDIRSGEIIRDVRIECDQTVAALKEFERAGEFHLHLYDMNNLYATRRDKELDMYEQISGVKATIVPAPLSAYAEKHRIRANKLMVIAAHEEVALLLKHMRSAFPTLTHVLSKPIFLETISPEGTKSALVRYMSEHFGVPVSEIAAVGDSLNDTDMIAAAGLGAAVQNAHEELKRHADLILKHTNNESAIAELIDRYIL